jgi:tetratricopeptide (TPR) repeat protein
MNIKNMIGLVALAALMTLCVPSTAGADGRSGLSSRQADQDAEETASPSLQLILSVNAGLLKQTPLGCPLIIRVYIRNYGAEKARWLQNQLDYYSSEAGDEEKEKAKDLVEKWQSELDGLQSESVTLSTKESTPESWISFETLDGKEYKPLDWPIELLSRPEGEEIALREIRQELIFGLSPAASQGVAPGFYTVRATLASKLIPGLDEDLESNEVTIVFADQAVDAEAERVKNYLLAQYYLMKGDFESAEATARSIVDADAEDINALILLGDSLDGLGRGEEAEKTYQQAMNAIAKMDIDEPPPPHLIRQINKYLRERLRKAREK